MAAAYKSPVVDIDLITGQIAPKLFDIERNRTLVRYCQGTLKRNNENLKPPAEIVKATLRIEFGTHIRHHGPRFWYIGESSFTVYLTDERGSVWKHTYISPTVGPIGYPVV